MEMFAGALTGSARWQASPVRPFANGMLSDVEQFQSLDWFHVQVQGYIDFYKAQPAEEGGEVLTR